MNETRYHRSFGGCLRHSRGFTLLEMLIVFAIVGILAGIAIPSFNQMRMSQEYRRAARDVNSILREARTRAISRNRDNTVVIESAGRRYRLIQGVDTVHDWVVLPTGVNFNASPNIVFRPSGAVNSVGDIVIGIQDNSAVTKYQVTITPTGRIQITR